MKRPDSPAILGLIGLAGLLVLGWIILSALGKEVPPEAWVAISTVAGIVGGWVGKTLTSEPVEPVKAGVPPGAIFEPPVHPPVVNDIAERQRISEYLAGDEFIAGPDVHA